MAAFPTEITVKSSEYRPCMVGDKKALFHRWVHISQIVPPSVLKGGHSGGVIADDVGLVEFEDGSVGKVFAEKIHFLDSGNLFHENALFWRTEENNAQ